jgi:hypothetical protein
MPLKAKTFDPGINRQFSIFQNGFPVIKMLDKGKILIWPNMKIKNIKSTLK